MYWRLISTIVCISLSSSAHVQSLVTLGCCCIAARTYLKGFMAGILQSGMLVLGLDMMDSTASQQPSCCPCGVHCASDLWCNSAASWCWMLMLTVRNRRLPTNLSHISTRTSLPAAIATTQTLFILKIDCLWQICETTPVNSNVLVELFPF